MYDHALECGAATLLSEEIRAADSLDIIVGGWRSSFRSLPSVVVPGVQVHDEDQEIEVVVEMLVEPSCPIRPATRGPFGEVFIHGQDEQVAVVDLWLGDDDQIVEKNRGPP